MRITADIVEILKLGLTGLVFLLMLMGFRLLHQQQGKQEPSETLLKRASLFVWQSIIVACLVAAVQFGSLLLTHDLGASQKKLDSCLTEIASLNRVSTHPDQSTDTLRSAIRNTWTACGRPGGVDE